MPYPTLPDCIEQLLENPLGRALLNKNAASIRILVEEIVSNDLFLLRTLTGQALKIVQLSQPTEQAVHDHIFHSIKCYIRNKSNIPTYELPHVDVDGFDNLIATEGAPTIIIAPMTLATVDALALLTFLIKNRTAIVYGEHINDAYKSYIPDNFFLIDRRNLRMNSLYKQLMNGGVLCTYPDFVYSGHQTFPGELFGRPRLYSSAFVKLCAIPGAAIVPLIAVYNADRIEVKIDPGIELETGEGARSINVAVIVALIQSLLERLIRAAPTAWLLLTSLTAEISYDLRSTRSPSGNH
jgi:lauroyl/myristoyl acyltransferase